MQSFHLLLLLIFHDTLAAAFSAGASSDAREDGTSTSTSIKDEDDCDAANSITAPNNNDIVSDETSYDDDRTWLDILGEVAKEYLTHQVIPATDEACVWDWRVARCEPFCDCEWQFQWGDYHLGRPCRLRRQQALQCASSSSPDTLDSKGPKRVLFRVIQGLQRGRNYSGLVWQRFVLVVQRHADRVRAQSCTDMPSKMVMGCIPQHDLTWRERLLCQPPPQPPRMPLDDNSNNNEDFDQWAICQDEPPHLPSYLLKQNLLSFSSSYLDEWTAGVANANPNPTLPRRAVTTTVFGGAPTTTLQFGTTATGAGEASAGSFQQQHQQKSSETDDNDQEPPETVRMGMPLLSDHNNQDQSQHSPQELEGEKNDAV